MSKQPNIQDLDNGRFDTESAHNLFYFVRDGIIESLGVASHRLHGTDDEKLTMLRARVDSDYTQCKRFDVPTEWKSPGKNFSVDSYRALERLGKSGLLFENVFDAIGASRMPLVCITPIVDGMPKIDKTVSHSHIAQELAAERNDGMVPDYLVIYMTPAGFNIPALINDDYFVAIKTLFKNRNYVSCLKLIVSFIDTMAFLAFGNANGVFVRWLESYADLNSVGITATQLWEFRNSILHMSNSDSRKVIAGEILQLHFFVATSGTHHSEGTFNIMDLILALQGALEKWIQFMNSDPSILMEFIHRYDTILSDVRFVSATHPSQ